MEDEPKVEAPVVFRAGKRRKIYRQRADENDTLETDTTTPTPIAAFPTSLDDLVATASAQASEEPQGLSVADALRLRNARRPKHRGVNFRRSDDPASRSAPEDGSLVLHEQQQLMGIDTRFAPQTGMATDVVNKHMEEYVESALAKRYTGASASQSAEAKTQGSTVRPPGLDVRKAPEGVPMMQGRLQEIDLGDEVRSRNVAMTERARRRLEGEAVPDEEDEDAAAAEKAKKPRLGPDGKPWRGRKRRGSEDIKRDQIVEEFLHENKLDIYEQPAQQTYGPEDDELAGDDRIAEEFKQNFIDAMQARRSRRQPAINAPRQPPRAQDAQGEVLKGPKLGGSRNQRAAMRDVLLAQQEAARKPTTRR